MRAIAELAKLTFKLRELGRAIDAINLIELSRSLSEIVRNGAKGEGEISQADGGFGDGQAPASGGGVFVTLVLLHGEASGVIVGRGWVAL